MSDEIPLFIIAVIIQTIIVNHTIYIFHMFMGKIVDININFIHVSIMMKSKDFTMQMNYKLLIN